MKHVYFDNSATTRLDDEVLKEMMPYLTEEYGNASSIYKLGRNTRNAVETAREKIAKAINAEPDEIYFTSGGTESDNTAIRGIAYHNKKKGNHIITSKIEHPAILETCKQLEKEGFEITYLNVDKNGIIDLENNNTIIKVDAVFPVLHGKNGEDGTVQGLLELSGIPIIGCDTLSSSLCMDKYLSHKLAESYGIKVAKSVVINNKTTRNDINKKLEKLKYPLFVKCLQIMK